MSTVSVSGRMAPPLGTGEGQEVLQFLIRLEHVGGEIIHGADRLGSLYGRSSSMNERG
ncbi:hypothetical protein [Streptomyces sp. NPDC007264]|uniref:hypothetical protein n=1 Tax=Streptomyces sp. NPDC007264 TaxID=3364777 RepID=UPI0036DBE608